MFFYVFYVFLVYCFYECNRNPQKLTLAIHLPSHHQPSATATGCWLPAAPVDHCPASQRGSTL
jgi:hypothetical protein